VILIPEMMSIKTVDCSSLAIWCRDWTLILCTGVL